MLSVTCCLVVSFLVSSHAADWTVNFNNNGNSCCAENYCGEQAFQATDAEITSFGDYRLHGLPQRCAIAENNFADTSLAATYCATNPVPTFGIGRVTRAPGMISAWVDMRNTQAPMETYTIWTVWFNNWKACATHSCTLDDLSNDDARPGFAFCGGGVLDASGNDFGRCVYWKDQPRRADDAPLFYPLEDTQNAEIHIVVRRHGPALSDQALFWAQISDRFGACDQPGVTCANFLHFPSLVPDNSAGSRTIARGNEPKTPLGSPSRDVATFGRN